MSNRVLRRLTAGLFGQPSLIYPENLEEVVEGLGARLDEELYRKAAEEQAKNPEHLQPVSQMEQEAVRDLRRYEVRQGLAIVPVMGAFLQRGPAWLEAYGFRTYEGIRRDVSMALVDEDVRGILLRVDSPGGVAAGCGDVGKDIRAADAVKPVFALADSMAMSAAYWITAAAREVYATDTAMVGSIGTVIAHADYSGALEKAGVRITYIHAGARKVDGAPTKPLSDRARKSFQTRVDYLNGLFTSAIAEYRGLDAGAVAALEAEIFSTPDAIQQDLVDGVRTYDELLDELAARLDGAAGPTVQVPMGVQAAAAGAAALSRSTTEAVSAEGTDNTPPLGGHEEVAMGDIDEKKKSPGAGAPPAGGGGGASNVVSLEAMQAKLAEQAAALEAAEAKAAKAEARAELAAAGLTAAEEAKKEAVIKEAIAEGRATPAMKPSLEKLASTCKTAEELRAELQTFTPNKIRFQQGATPLAAAGGGENLAGANGGSTLTAEQIRVGRALGVSPQALETYGDVKGVNWDNTVTLANGDVVPVEELTGPVGRA